MLASYASEKTGVALDYYAAGSYRDRKNILVYVASEPDAEKIAELSVSQVMKTIYVYETEEEKEEQEKRQAAELIPVSVKQAAEGIPEIMV